MSQVGHFKDRQRLLQKARHKTWTVRSCKCIIIYTVCLPYPLSCGRTLTCTREERTLVTDTAHSH